MPRSLGKNVPTGKPRGVLKTESEWSTFLERLAQTGNVTEAAEHARMSRLTVYNKYRRDPEFAKLFDEAKTTGYESLEDEAVRRGKDGVVEDIYHQGVVVGDVRKYSDCLLMFLLKGHKPKTYRDSGSGAGVMGDPAALATAMFQAAQAMDACTDQKDTRD